jgi:hypothetical protein
MITVYELVSNKEFHSAKPLIPERELLVATLDRAVLDYYGSNQEISEEAADWLFENTESERVFSFNWVCEHLGIEAEEVRNRVGRLTFPKNVSQAHRWLRSKVQSQGMLPPVSDCMERSAA